MSIIVGLVQGTPEWLKWRDGGIGASEIFVLAAWAEALGFKEPNPRPIEKRPDWLQTPAMLYRRKLGLEPGVSVNANMARGNRMEPIIRSEFNRMFKTETIPVCVEAGAPWQVSLDGYHRPNGSAVILEIKAPARRWLALPEYVYYQTTYQRAVLRASEGKDLKIRAGVSAGYETDEGEHKTDGISFDIFQVEEDIALERWLLRLSRFFLTTYLKKKKEPPLVKGDITTREDRAFLDVAADYALAHSECESAKSTLDSARDALLSESGEFVGTLTGGGVRLTNVFRSGSIDYRRALGELLPDADVEPYRKPSTQTIMVKVEG